MTVPIFAMECSVRQGKSKGFNFEIDKPVMTIGNDIADEEILIQKFETKLEAEEAVELFKDSYLCSEDLLISDCKFGNDELTGKQIIRTSENILINSYEKSDWKSFISDLNQVNELGFCKSFPKCMILKEKGEAGYSVSNGHAYAMKSFRSYNTKYVDTFEEALELVKDPSFCK